MNEIRVDSWSDLQEQLFEGAWNPDLEKFRSPCAFRGLNDSRYELATRLVRLGGSFRDLEQHLLRNFQKYSHRDVVERDSAWHWLSVAQHHGLPTRLLDWTFSPFVAMHFATASTEKMDCDGAIWAVNFDMAHRHLPELLGQKLDEVGAHVFTVEMLAEKVKSLDGLDRLSKTDFVVFFEPPSMDDRIINQFALFSVMSNAEAILSDWLVDLPDLYRKIVIPKELKWEVRDKLDQANITERVLFPGLDGLSSWLQRHYSPRPKDRHSGIHPGPL